MLEYLVHCEYVFVLHIACEYVLCAQEDQERAARGDLGPAPYALGTATRTRTRRSFYP